MKTQLFNENSHHEFDHHYIHIESKKLHYVTLGEGPAVLLIPGWPQTWYAWHKVMIELAKQGYQAIAVDLPGTGNSAPLDGSYDTGRIAKILSMLMTQLEYPTYSVVGHDIGMWVAYALASDFPESVTRLAVTEAVIPGLAPAPPIFVEPSENIFLWHFMFNQTLDLPEALIAGREDTYLNYMFDKWSWHKDKVATETYIEAYKIPGRLAAGFNYYRSIPETIRQNKMRETKNLDMPVLAIGAEHATDNAPYETMKKVSPHLTSAIVKDCGHFIMEEQPKIFSSLILEFLQQEKAMPLLAEIENWLKSRPTAQGVNSLQALREQVNKDIIDKQGIQQDASYQQSFHIAVSDGAEIEVRIYVPYSLENTEQRPALVFAHGGGWCLGNLDAWDRTCRLLAETTQQVVFSVDYRLAPEFKFPTPLNDFFTAFRYIYENVSQFGVDQNRVAVGGDSAGANIAAATCLMAKQHPEIKVSHQLLFYPALDATMSSNSYSQYAEGYGLDSSTMVYCWDQYVQHESEKHNEFVSPLLAQSLEGLPDATIFVCEYDPVRDDGERYAQKLWDMGIQVNFYLLEGMIHGAIHMLTVSPDKVKSIYRNIRM